ncbi:MAG TPA: PKD domain-containing protein, partial [Methanoregulaceae archaeon]|nr:PKD domain-containing protein [Methanoregulaceae archaeon]
TVAKTCDDGSEKNSTISKQVSVSAVPPPVADFTMNTTAGDPPFTIQFTDSSTNALNWSWQFGDGSTST